MVYWCYFLNIWNTKVIENIEDKKVITFPVKNNIVSGDVIFIYTLQEKNRGFAGYIRANDNLRSNLDGNNDYKYKIFDDRTLNKFVVDIKHHKILAKKIKKNSIFGEEKEIVSEFGKYLRNHKYIVNISKDMGKMIHQYIKKYLENDDSSNSTISDTSSNTSREINKDSTEQVPIKKSRYIIPIMVSPCEEFYEEIKTIDDDKLQWMLEHFMSCHICDITNNNERVTLNMIYDKITLYYKMSDDDEITNLLESYHSLNFYKMKDMKENCMKIIKICDEDNDYYKCYCIVGKMDCPM